MQSTSIGVDNFEYIGLIPPALCGYLEGPELLHASPEQYFFCWTVPWSHQEQSKKRSLVIT